MRNIIVKVTETEELRRNLFYQKMRKLQRVLIFCVEFRELSHLTRDLSQAEKKMNVEVVILSVAQLVKTVMYCLLSMI